MVNNLNNNINVRVSTEEMFELNLIAQNTNTSISEIVREAIKERIENNPIFLVKKEKELKEYLEKIKEQIKVNEIKTKELKKIPRKEKDFLIKSKEILEKNPQYLSGQISLYLSEFKKPYKINSIEYFKLLQEADDRTN
jgi:hypothetical protein